MFATVYAVTRHCGGPEEGGWWYNWYERVKTVCMPKAYRKARNFNKAEQFKARLKEQFSDRAWGNIYSVNDGLMITVIEEDYPGEFESKETPHYE